MSAQSLQVSGAFPGSPYRHAWLQGKQIFLTLSICLVAVLGSCATAQAAQETSDFAPASRPLIVRRIDESQLVTLKGNTHPMARAKFDKGRVVPSLPMTDLILVLKRSPEQQAAFDKFVASQYDASSPNFHHWLTAQQVGEDFGPAPSDIDIISNWLRNHELSVDEVTKDHMSIRFSGTASQVESTFHTEIHNLEVPRDKGEIEKHVANMSDPQIPAALVPAVVGVKALHNFFPRPMHKLGSLVKRDSHGGWQRISPTPDNASDSILAKSPAQTARPEFGTIGGSGSNTYPVEDVTPYDFATIYNVLPLWNSNIDGTGQTIAIAGTSDINPSDVATFRSSFGPLPVLSASASNPPSLTFELGNGTDPGQCGVTPTSTCTLDDQIENSLDVEWSGAVAKGASIILVSSGANSTTTDTLYASENYIVQNKTAEIMNVSYGECELGLGVAGNSEYNTLWQTASSEGIAVFVSTGDSGSAGCDEGSNQSLTLSPSEYGLQVSGLASTQYNTAVGGTDFNWGTTASPYWNSTNAANGSNAINYVPEIPWNDTCVNPLAVQSLESDASQVGASGVNDAESACNFVANYYVSIYEQYGVDLSFFVNTIGGSGGQSSCINGDGANTSSCTQGYPKPTWQNTITPPDGHRDIPDVSFFASNGFLGSAYLICVSETGSACTYSSTTENQYQEVGGTSVSSPTMAGVMALINQKTNNSQGTPNGELYALAAKQNYSTCTAETVKTSSSCFFNDVDTDTNAQPCDAGNSPNCKVIHSGDGLGILSGYSAVTGYDLASGLGSLNVANVVNAWPATALPTISLTSTSLTFASTQEGSTSAVQSVTLENTGTTVLNISGVTLTGSDQSSFILSKSCGASLASKATCVIKVAFAPKAAGTLTASVSIADNAAHSPQSITLTGVGTAPPAPIVTLSASALTFASTTVGSSAATQTVTLKNTGTATLSLTGISITGANATSFSETNTCGSSVAISASCSIVVTFKPAAAGALAASVSIADNATGSPQAITLKGTGTAPTGPAVTLTPASLTFASTVVGKSTATQVVTLKNTGTSALTITSITRTGTDASSFVEGNTCGTSVAAGATCKIEVLMKPAVAGKITAAISVVDNAKGSPQSIALTGTATAPAGPAVTLTPTSLTFASTEVGKATAAQVVTLKNTGTEALTITSITRTGTDASSFVEGNTCGASVAAGATCKIEVLMKPAVSGAITGAISIVDNATGSPQSIALTGTATAAAGPAVTLSATSEAFEATAVGKPSAAKVVTLQNTGTESLTITSITLGGTDKTSFVEGNNCAATLAAGASCKLEILFKPAVTGALTGSISIVDNAPGSPQIITLNGTGN